MEDDCSSILNLVEDYIVGVWEGRLSFMTKISVFHSLSTPGHPYQ